MKNKILNDKEEALEPSENMTIHIKEDGSIMKLTEETGELNRERAESMVSFESGATNMSNGQQQEDKKIEDKKEANEETENKAVNAEVEIKEDYVSPPRSVKFKEEEPQSIPKTAVIRTFIKKKTILNEEHFYEELNKTNESSKYQKGSRNKKVLKFKRASTLEFQLDIMKYKMRKLFFTSDYDKKNKLEKIFYWCIEFPFNILRDMTIPPCEKENWKQFFFIIMPLSSTLFLIITFKCKI